MKTGCSIHLSRVSFFVFSFCLFLFSCSKALLVSYCLGFQDLWCHPLSVSSLAHGSPVSALGHQAHHSTLIHQPFCSTLAPPSLGSTRLPCPFGSTLASCCSAYATDFRAFVNTLSHHPLSPTGSASVLRHPGSTLAARHCGFALASRPESCTGQIL